MESDTLSSGKWHIILWEKKLIPSGNWTRGNWKITNVICHFPWERFDILFILVTVTEGNVGNADGAESHGVITVVGECSTPGLSSSLMRKLEKGSPGGGGSNPLTPGKLRFWLIFRTSKMAQAREVKNPKVVWTLSLLVWDWRKAKGPTTSRVETTSNWTMQLWSSWYTWKSIADRVPKQFYCLYTKAINNIF